MIKKYKNKVDRVKNLIINIMANRGIDLRQELEAWDEMQNNNFYVFLHNGPFIEDKNDMFGGEDYYIIPINIDDNTLCDNTFEKLLEKIADSINERIEKIYLIFISDSMENRISVENIIDENYNRKIRSVIKKKGKKSCKCEALYIVDCDYFGKDIVLSDINRYEINHMPKLNFERQEKSHYMRGYVMSIRLLQLIELYNMVGDSLFKNNVRYGIGDQLGVDASISETLANNPEDFWYKNNGITIVADDDNFKLDRVSEIVLQRKVKDKLQFSVVNGAQTITASARWYYQHKNEKECNIKDAMVLLRIICVGKDKQKIKEISVALNRQKPIKSEDIAYTNKFVQILNSYLEKNKQKLGSHFFYIVKRGEKDNVNSQMDLGEFARARLACLYQPGSARTLSNNKLLKVKSIDGENRFELEQIFDPSVYNENEVESEFARSYNAVSFAHKLQVNYGNYCKEVLKEITRDSIEETILRNGKWYFVAYCVWVSNSGETEFSKFDVDRIEQESITKILCEFCRYLKKVADENNIIIDSNELKKDDLFRKLIDSVSLPHKNKQVISDLYAAATVEEDEDI